MPAQKRRIGDVRDGAYESLQQALLDGRLRPGQLVSQRDLVGMANISVGALREVLPRLQSEGLIRVLPQRGIQVPAIDLAMIRDAFQFRAALEREAVRHGALNLSDDAVDEQKRLHHGILRELADGPTTDVLKRGQDIDDGFHAMLVKATDNAVLINAYDINTIRIRLIKLDRIRLSETTLPSAFGDHLDIIAGIEARDPDRAAAAMDKHIANARKRALEI